MALRITDKNPMTKEVKTYNIIKANMKNESIATIVGDSMVHNVFGNELSKSIMNGESGLEG